MESLGTVNMMLSTIDLPEQNMQNHVDPANTAVSSLRLPKEKDGSVVSAVTLPASLEPTLSQTSVGETQSEVPKQVIFREGSPEEPDDGKLGDPTASPSTEPVVHVISDPAGIAAAVRVNSLSNARDDARSATGSVVSAPARTDPISKSDSNDLTDYISSPEIQNAIMERSPGGRYVRFREKLGSGASKDVYRAYDTQEGIEVAWNVVNLSGVPKNERNRIVNEVRLLERLHHHNIISFHGSWVNRERQEVNFVTEILSSGTLKAFISKVQVIRWKIAKRWAIQILKGLEYLHSQDPPVIHRDLKCENIFINGTSGDLRIGDLGLSTVHRNGRVLSVLGTPEFMAPDMYEDKPYDEKVDIYAFGMCVLEIFTQEIPYSECTNPAQIYKKVSSGEPPEILGRIQSKHARDFVNFCLGYRDNEGNYVRPTASELLQHPFLAVRENDDDEVIVDPPMRETTIAEAVEPSGSQSMSSYAVAVEGSTTQDDEIAKTGLPPRAPRPAPEFEDDDDAGDEFEEMPESETNMKRVKVLMGRDTEWKEDEQAQAATVTPVLREATGTGGDHGAEMNQIPSQGIEDNSARPVASHPVEVTIPTSVDSKPNDSKQESSHYNYLVATVVIEDEGQNVRPYADEILKLVVTLPIEGQTQNVQFDFDLVEDDPIQVAKEMVQELGIPQGAVLEISETISGLARAARMKQDRYAIRANNAQNKIPSHPVQQGAQTPAQQLQPQAPPPTSIQGSNANTNAQHQQIAPSQQHHQPIHLQQQQPVQLQQGSNLHNPPAQTPMLPNAHLPHSTPVFDYSQPNLVSTQLPHSHFQGQHELNSNMNGYQMPQQLYLPPQTAFGSSHSVPGEHQQMQVPRHQSFSSAPALSQHAVLQSGGPNPPQHVNFMQAQHAVPSDHVPQIPIGQNGQTPIPTQVNIPSGQPAQMYPPSESIVQDGRPPLPAPRMQPAPPAQTHSSEQLQTTPPTSFAAHNVASHPTQNVEANASVDGMSDSIRTDENSSTLLRSLSDDAFKAGDGAQGSLQQDQVETQTTSPSLSDSSRNVADDLDSDEEDSDDELRKLDEDFQKNLQRARKVYDNRMDSLQRCKIEREEQHLKTLEKHEKERAEFEKRLAQEAEQQRKRIQQLQLEWDRQRELARTKKKHERSNSDTTNDNSAIHARPEHTLSRSMSNASSTKSMEARNELETSGGGAGDTEI